MAGTDSEQQSAEHSFQPSDPHPARPAAKPPRPTFDSLTLHAVSCELRERLEGGQIQDVRQPERDLLLLGVRAHGQSQTLLICTDARYARAHLTTLRRRNGPEPPAFCATVRRLLEGGVIRSVLQRGFDRILELTVERVDDNGEAAETLLIAELMGRHSNLILVNADGRIIDALKRITHRINRVREILPGLPYIGPPSPAGRVDPLANGADEALPQLDRGALGAAIREQFEGISPFLAAEVAARAELQGLPAAWDSLFGMARANRWAPVHIQWPGGAEAAYPFPSVQIQAELQRPTPLSVALESAFKSAILRGEFETERSRLSDALSKEAVKIARQRDAIAAALNNAGSADRHRENGELLMANLHAIAARDTEAVLLDYYSGTQEVRRIPLDPQLTARANAEECFKRYRKARDARRSAELRSPAVEQRTRRLAEAAAELERVTTRGPDSLAELRSLHERLRSSGAVASEPAAAAPGARQAPEFDGHKIRRYNTAEGYEILVGETATANDFLTTRLAAPTDIWLHVRAAASAHVVIRTRGRPDSVPAQVLQKAAAICAQHSGQKHSSLVPVDYTQRKYVRKPRGAAPGGVQVQREKTLHVSPSE